MRRQNKHLILLLVLISIELFIKGIIKVFFSNQIGIKYNLSTMINIYPIINNEGISLTKMMGTNYSDLSTILILMLMLLAYLTVYFMFFYFVEKYEKNDILCIPIILIISSIIIRIIVSITFGYTIDYISVINRFVCDFADIYLWLGSLLSLPVGFYFLYKEEAGKSKMNLSLFGSIKYDLDETKLAFSYYFLKG